MSTFAKINGLHTTLISFEMNPKLLRTILLITLGTVSIYLICITAFGIREHNRSEKILKEAYGLAEQRSDGLFHLFAAVSQADNLFRLYALDMKRESYRHYAEKVTRIGSLLDSLMETTPFSDNLRQNAIEFQWQRESAQRYAVLKADLDKLILALGDSVELPDGKLSQEPPVVPIGADSLVAMLLLDTTFTISADTLINRKENLLKRIFRAKDDTIITKDNAIRIIDDRVLAVRKVAERVLDRNSQVFKSGFTDLSKRYRILRLKEREIIGSNYHLLASIRSTMEEIREYEKAGVIQISKSGLSLHEKAGGMLKKNLKLGSAAMVLALCFLQLYRIRANQYEKQLRIEREHSESMALQKTEILTVVAHDVRAPVSSLISLINILLDEKVIGPGKLTLLKEIRSDVELVGRTMEDILTLEKMDAGKFFLFNDYFSPKLLLEQVAEMHAHSARNKGLSLEMSLDIPAGMDVLGSAPLTRQVVSNLVGNAIRYTKAGKVELCAHYHSKEDRKWLEILVRDTGKGIDPEHQKDIFRRYFMASGSAGNGGFGLGLYICNTMAEIMGGKITLLSALGKGSEFRFSVPLQKVRSRNLPIESYTKNDLPDDLHLVVIDDNLITLSYIRTFFSDRTKIFTFSDPCQALDHIQSNIPDCVITDISMPQMDGWSVLREIRENENTSCVPVIKFTSSTSQSLDFDDIEKKTYKFDGSLEKPIDQQRLFTLLIAMQDRKKGE
ncbi:hybrid sensor histidine kinase/response regulator [Sphingobacterium endophyticum]|uniref:hybrid sensor histidine kinase/response regulator n=1 Tax=Sphingobacterium endophyticum TaxID=2546448 RepID=UPI0018CE644D|nr:hybrid sensor histidine kinase/response regulator [Sphingobacterium endophyticum]